MRTEPCRDAWVLLASYPNLDHDGFYDHIERRDASGHAVERVVDVDGHWRRIDRDAAPIR